MELHIDSEFQSLIPPLTDDEFQRLEKSILTEGVRDPLITWNGTIIDGHNRYRICQKHGIEFKTTEREFTTRDAAKIWIIEHQLGRRNLEPGQKAALVIEQNEAKVREQARLRQVSKLKQNQAQKKADNRGAHESPTDVRQEKGRTAEILAKQAGVGQMTIKRVMKVRQEDPDLYDKVRSGEVAATTAYEQITTGKKSTRKKKIARFAEDGRRICTICGEPINEGDHYTDKLGWHYSCGRRRESENRHKYLDADSALRSNNPTYTTDSLRAELLASVKTMRTAINESIAINESMGVKLTSKQKKDLDAEVGHLIRIINKI